MGTSLHVGGLVTLVAGVHYMYMREYWVQLHKSPVVYRYIDWTITVPLQMIEFNLILKAAKAPISGNCSSAVKKSFANMRLIVSVGWSIYPLGYFLGFLTGIADQTALNVVYNIADLLNKIGFVLACWSCAKEDTEKNAILA